MTIADNAVVAITGASSGIGMALARRFAGGGRKLLLIARRRERLEALARELPGAVACPLDLRDGEALAALMARHPPPDVWINNAGLARGMQPVDQTPAADLTDVITTNVQATLNATRLAAATMRRRGRGHIVNITSAAAFHPYKGGHSYAMSKAALHMLTQCLRHDFAGTAVRVSEVAPGAVGDTEFAERRFERAGGSFERAYGGITPLAAADVADAVHYCVMAPAHVNVELMLLYPVQQIGGVRARSRGAAADDTQASQQVEVVQAR